MKKTLKIRFIITLILTVLAIVVEKIKVHSLDFILTLISTTFFLTAYFVIGFDILQKAVKNIFSGNIFDENFLMLVATIGALIIGEFPEAVAVLFLYQIGEEFQRIAVGKSRNAIKDLMDIKPQIANVKKGNQILEVEPEKLKVGEIIVIKPGERVPVDCRIISGSSSFDTKTVTGEPKPKDIGPQEILYSGVININKPVEAKVLKKFEDSTVSKILELVEEATSKKAKTENFITKFARIYTPIVCLAALIIALIPPFILNEGYIEWVYRALTFLVVSCPCALVISVPLGFFGGIGGASKNGILIKGSNYVEALSKSRYAFFDKTGTITKGVFEIQKIKVKDMSQQEFIRIVAHAEMFSNHPIAVAIKNKYKGAYDAKKIQGLEEISGMGISARIFFKETLVGNAKLMRDNYIEFDEVRDPGTVVYVAIDNEYKGYILISDTIKSEARDAIYELKQKGNIKRTCILTGDEETTANQVAADVMVDECHAELLPDEKLARVEKTMNEKKKKYKVIFVGDGINDSPCLARADIGIAMGGIGADAAIEAADVVIMSDELSKITKAIQISKKTMKVVKNNIAFALLIKIAVLILAAFGFADMWLAVFADVGVSIIAILNSMTTLKIK